ncbi:HlyD family secretion protein [Neomoorella thermoacetica]|uniref:Multidrug resistance efflux pump n=3 Tax=Neomoorella thermoacetica TaxID=1525 RepID=A0A0S6UC98_NEOTH|nr:efflux RND transporter periplasmic adaptor subunit [Moorella thermoacetica]AKX95177.1 putative multidrug resistance protein EmrK [Moorella thermoacetica]AKX97802.1 putative multidrug resistance protein EmrK [Moorella thermoacetica]APC09526.1 putative multidrug resistance protein EmrK [Moorella thermoacetica]OIQ09983.1 putative multidrug resistance protein EmrK [Moorella thermoacetica]OIQ12270.1 putative multidrug resistance protein EmrK [Moorella thermoacetica]
MSRRLVVILVLVLALAGAGAIAFYYYYENLNFASTDDARVAADTVTVSPEIAGKLLEWRVQEGDEVKAGQVLGRQDLESSLTSSAVNPQALGTAAGVMAQKAEIKSPIDGQVIQSKALVGEMAAPGMALAIIADTEHLYISANIKETVIEKVKVGQVVDVTIDAFPDRHFSGRVTSIGRATTSVFSLLPAQNSNGNYTKVTQVIPVKIQLLDASDVKLLPGMNATVRIHIR